MEYYEYTTTYTKSNGQPSTYKIKIPRVATRRNVKFTKEQLTEMEAYAHQYLANNKATGQQLYEVIIKKYPDIKLHHARLFLKTYRAKSKLSA